MIPFYPLQCVLEPSSAEKGGKPLFSCEKSSFSRRVAPLSAPYVRAAHWTYLDIMLLYAEMRMGQLEDTTN